MANVGGVVRNLLPLHERKLYDAAAIRHIRDVLHYRGPCLPARRAERTHELFGDEWLYWEHLYFVESSAAPA
jgi:hypothetical protein